MAEEGGGNSGKVILGCSCLSMVSFFVLSMVARFAVVPLAEALPDLAVLWGFMGGIGGLISNICCCLSFVGVIIGVVMLLMGGKDDQDI